MNDLEWAYRYFSLVDLIERYHEDLPKELIVEFKQLGEDFKGCI